MKFLIQGGTVTSLYQEQLPLETLGAVQINRASYVEWYAGGSLGAAGWYASVTGNVCLGPFSTRRQALAAEVAYLEEHLLKAGQHGPTPSSCTDREESPRAESL